MRSIARSLCGTALSLLLFFPLISAFAQSSTSGDVVGLVTDPSGAAVSNTVVTITSLTTGRIYTAKTNGDGSYHVTAMQPGSYRVIVNGGQLISPRVSVSVANGQISTADVHMGMAATEVSVSVNGAPSLLQADSGNIATTLTEEQLNTLPNPGQSLTNLTQTMPGTTMVARTTGTGVLGYGSTYGLPANSNVYSVNGGKGNDPVTDGPLDGALNTLIGEGDIQEVTVTTVGNAEYGFLVGAQIDAISKSGTNKFHGDAYYGWNGRALNANSFFNKRNGVARSFDNVNQVQTAIGGPIYRNKTFFFGDYEYYSILLPTSTAVYLPSALLQTTTLASIPSTEKAFYQQMFALYNAAPGGANAVPLTTGGVVNPNINTFRSTLDAPDNETYIGARIDHIFNEKDSAYVHVKIDRGLQTAYIDTISTSFNVPGHVPITDGQLSETHIFGPRAVNQFSLSGVYYNEIFPPPAGIASFPMTLAFGSTLPLTTLGGSNSSFPSGHRTFNFLIRDSFNYQMGKHAIKAGIILDHSNISDQDIDSNLYPSVAAETLSQFESGIVGSLTEGFPVQASAPLSMFNLSPFVQDDWKIKPNFTLSAGIRVEHFADPICKSNCIAHLASSFATLNNSTSTPYSQLISANQRNAYPGFQSVQVAPRLGFAWTPLPWDKKLVVRGAYGLFVDAYSAYIVEGLLTNVPQVASFTTTSGLLAPNVAGSATSNVAASNAAFTAGYSSAGTYQSISAAVKAAGGTFSAPSFNNSEFKNYPTYHEFNVGVQQELGKGTIFDLRYVGTYGYNELLRNAGANTYDPLNTSGQPTVNFAGLLATQPNTSFGIVTPFTQAGISNYNGLLASLVRRGKYITTQINYTWSHSLDDVSNGGRFKDNSLAISTQINPLSTADNYGNADYDVRQNLTANYILAVPHFGGPVVLTDGWQISGTFFANSGYPFSITDSTTASSLASYRYSGTILARVLPGAPQKCGRGAVNASCLGTAATASAPGTYFASATSFGVQRRNQFYGPNFFDADMSIFKTIGLVRHEAVKLKLGAQFYNILNHPNFAPPSNDVRSSTFGTITSTVGPPVSLLGSNLGGDSSPRMIEFTGKLSF